MAGGEPGHTLIDSHMHGVDEERKERKVNISALQEVGELRLVLGFCEGALHALNHVHEERPEHGPTCIALGRAHYELWRRCVSFSVYFSMKVLTNSVYIDVNCSHLRPQSIIQGARRYHAW